MKHKNLTCDVGAILFGDAVTITADGPWQHFLHELTGRKWGNLDVENETGCGIVPYVYSDHKLVNAIQWAVGLELLLLIDDPWRVYLTTDHPNGGGFWRYPEILRLLMDVEFRKAEVRKLPAEALNRITLADIDRQYTISEMVIITSAGPARALGLKQKGHLGVGADGDVTIYSAKPDSDGVMFTLSAIRAQGRQGRRRRGRRSERSARDASSSCIRSSIPAIEEFIRPTVPEGLHDVVRELPDGDDAAEASRDVVPCSPPAVRRCRNDHADAEGTCRRGPARGRGDLSGRHGQRSTTSAIRALPVYPRQEAVPRRRLLHGRRRGAATRSRFAAT